MKMRAIFEKPSRNSTICLDTKIIEMLSQSTNMLFKVTGSLLAFAIRYPLASIFYDLWEHRRNQPHSASTFAEASFANNKKRQAVEHPSSLPLPSKLEYANILPKNTGFVFTRYTCLASSAGNIYIFFTNIEPVQHFCTVHRWSAL